MDTGLYAGGCQPYAGTLIFFPKIQKIEKKLGRAHTFPPHPAGTSIISALFEGSYNGALRENLFLKHTQMTNTLHTKNNILHNYILY